jgi:hypothetical protein
MTKQTPMQVSNPSLPSSLALVAISCYNTRRNTDPSEGHVKLYLSAEDRRQRQAVLLSILNEAIEIADHIDIHFQSAESGLN